MRLKIGLVRILGGTLNGLLARWPSPSRVRVSHWDIVVDEKTGRRIRAIVLVPNSGEVGGEAKKEDQFSRIYVNIHGGGFCAGFASDDVDFCARVSTELNCVAVCCTYRFAPEHPYQGRRKKVLRGGALGALKYDNNIGCYGNIRRGWGGGGC